MSRRIIWRYPLRFTALLLFMLLVVEMVAILRTPDYSTELVEAKARYEDARKENRELIAALAGL